ncbi:MAG: DUF1080 domain-containing protein [Phycisphaerae bacterium]|nr:DUF1080 domain-containing protein [Tepidisphaeraceae bacterium]
MTRRLLVACLLSVLVVFGARAAENEAAVGAPNLVGKDLAGWKLKNEKASLWKVVGAVAVTPDKPKELSPTGEPGETPILVNDLKEKQHGSDVYTEQEFGDCEVHVELMVPKGSNSGVYLQGRYEIQILDSFGKGKEKKPGKGDLGGLYNTKEPNADDYEPKAPGEWQTLDIVFLAPRFGADGKKTEPAKFASVRLNGKEIHKDVVAPAPTGGQLSSKEGPTGPLMFQGDHGPVALRNVRVKALPQ